MNVRLSKRAQKAVSRIDARWREKGDHPETFLREVEQPGTARRALRFACKRAGLRQIGSHTLRHTFASHLAMRGAAPKAIQELLGHATVGMTARYMHLARSALREAVGLPDFRQPVGIAEAATV